MIQTYSKRINRYHKLLYEELPALKKSSKLSEQEIQEQEGRILLQRIKPQSYLILLDAKGSMYQSLEFSQHLASLMLYQSNKTLCFVIGGAYGFSQSVYQRADELLSLSPMTMPHQLVRAVFLEQFYRAMTIQRGEPYHHE